MKYILAVFGAAISWGISQIFPEALSQLIKVPGFYGGLTALGTVLTAGWIICLSKLSVFEKIEDLNNIGREKIVNYSRSMRYRITITIVSNCFLAVLIFITVFASQIKLLEKFDLNSMVGYILIITLGFWLGGSIDSWMCYNAIDGTKEEFVLAQLEMKSRKAFLTKLRKDAQDHPVSRDDPHLNGYTKDA